MLLKISFLTLLSSVPIGVHYDLFYATIQHVSDFNFVVAGDWVCDKKAHQTVINMQNKSRASVGIR